MASKRPQSSPRGDVDEQPPPPAGFIRLYRPHEGAGCARVRVAGIRVASAANDLGGKVWNPSIRWTVKHAVFVELFPDNGRAGLGECWCFDTAPDALIAFLRTEVAPNLLGATLAEARAAMAAMSRRATLTARHGILASALSGVDLALWDLAARTAGQPLWRAIAAGGPGAPFVYASGGLYGRDKTDADLAAELAGYARQGFGAVKMKVGGLDPAADLARVAAARQALGPDTGLIIDGVSSFDTAGAGAFFDAAARFGLLAFQAPVPPSDLDGMRRLRRAGVPVMAGEAEYRDEVFAELIEGGAVEILQVAPVACGGPTRVAALAARCRAAGIALSLETSSTAVATLAALHLGAALAEVAHVEVHQVHRVFFTQAGLAGAPTALSRWRPPDCPGLGFSLDPACVAPGFRIGRTECGAGAGGGGAQG